MSIAGFAGAEPAPDVLFFIALLWAVEDEEKAARLSLELSF
jgi:hypothetical protein